MVPTKLQRTRQSPAAWRTQTRSGATLTGAGGGALLLSILQPHMQGHHQVLVKLLVYLTPSLSFAVSAALNWLLRQFDAYLLKFEQNRKYDGAKNEAKRILSDPIASPENKALAQQLIDQAHRYKIDNARLQLRPSR